MDDEIHFGELAHTPHDQRMRPDQNQHYAVIAVQAPASQDLPIFVDLDAMREMECTHSPILRSNWVACCWAASTKMRMANRLS